jgi:tryptophanyl-tRNA synthetase
LWLPQRQLRKAIMKIVTNSLEPGQPKDPSDSALFAIYGAFANSTQRAAMRQAYADGIGWGDAKQQTFELIDGELAQAREQYDELLARPQEVEAILQQGAARARAFATPLLARIRQAVGIRKLS